MKSWTPRGSQPRPERPSDCNKLSPQRSQRLTFFVISVRSVVNSSRAEKNSTIFSWRRRTAIVGEGHGTRGGIGRHAPSIVEPLIHRGCGRAFYTFWVGRSGDFRLRGGVDQECAKGALESGGSRQARAPAGAEDLARVRAPSSGGAKDLSPGREPWVRRPLTPFRTRLPPRAGDECGQKAVASKPTAHAVG
jgi:hypothetical protein